MLRLLERWNSRADLERYFRDEHLYAELALARIRNTDPRQVTLERNLYAVSAYFAA